MTSLLFKVPGNITVRTAYFGVFTHEEFSLNGIRGWRRRIGGRSLNFIFEKSFRTQVFFVGPLILLFWTSGDVCPGFRSQGGSLACMLSHLCAMDSSDSTLVQYLLLYSSQQGSQSFSESFEPLYLQMYLQTFMGLKPTTEHATAQCSLTFDHSGWAGRCLKLVISNRKFFYFVCVPFVNRTSLGEKFIVSLFFIVTRNSCRPDLCCVL